jgi:hypothetical protein
MHVTIKCSNCSSILLLSVCSLLLLRIGSLFPVCWYVVRACPTAAVICSCILFGWRFAEKHSETAWGLEKCTCYQGPPRAPVAGNGTFSAENDCFSSANYNDWSRRWELNSPSLCTVHLFRFMGGDGRETKQRVSSTSGYEEIWIQGEQA